MNTMKWLAVAIVLMASSQAFAAKGYCGDLKNGFGPYDYRNPEFAQFRETVTGAHFTDDMQAGMKGNTGQIGGDLDYTLRAFPNHPGALELMASVGQMRKTVQVTGAKYPVECYFDRAIRFAPDDGGVRAQYGNFLYAQGKIDQALVMYRAAAELSPNEPSINYNLGLALAKNKKYPEALVYAKKAYALGFPLAGLKNMLVTAGKWTDDEPVKTADDAAAKTAADAPATAADKAADKTADKAADKAPK